MRVLPRVPAAARERAASGSILIASRIISSGMPGAGRSSTEDV
eukprot:CAMPEP_0181218864 /NCGR_PEP_ID=MMETSP1096-20121128/27935_1 /TAXON_ID=156174 ORGANISM="Chrysochromulina ericina, Strain CCMP281" /NCGR_SAMPLE_ID=MMETSP1096 /ASSEMBLY_ACC=CAM_ASM_000453 /LENGTH=42 /DNA_ID= /DNA_START= /DNA_END= /DNA_ORIENTATION=